MNSTVWAVLLAGGSGTRLLPLTRRLCGDERPKQFAPVLGNRTLLSLTRERLASVFPAGRTLFTVVEPHRRYYVAELFDVDSSRILVQPANRGTSAAIVYSLLRISRTDPDAIVAFFPTDHYFAEESAFCETVRNALEQVPMHERYLILIGVRPGEADADYGWIEPGARAGQTANPVLFSVSRFWEKPSRRLADELRRTGCLLNTFVMVGSVRTILELCEEATPRLLRAFAPLFSDGPGDPKTAQRVYRNLPPSDFSHHVLANCTDRLLVLPLAGNGWSDLGTEERVRAVLARERLVSAAGHAHYSGPNGPQAFHDWLEGYQKRLTELCHPPATHAPGQGPRS